MPRAFSSLLFVAIAMLAGCASGPTRPPSIPQPGLAAGLTNELYFGSQSSAPATVEVRVTNHALVPITLRRVEVDSPTMEQWGILKVLRYYNQKVAPGETKSFLLVVTAVTTTRRPSEPLQLRTVFEFESDGVYWRELLLSQQRF